MEAAKTLLLILMLITAPPGEAAAKPPVPPKAKKVVTIAKSLKSVKYRKGGDLRWGKRTDCSGFVQHVYRQVGVELPRNSRAQAEVGKLIAHKMRYDILRPGDLLFFRTRRHRIGHVGIYLGHKIMIHCTRGRGINGVRLTILPGSRYPRLLVAAKRIRAINGK